MGWLSETKLRELGIKFGKNVKVDSSCVIACNELEIGDNSRIDAFCFLSGKIKIGRHVHISVGATLAGSDGIEVGDFFVPDIGPIGPGFRQAVASLGVVQPHGAHQLSVNTHDRPLDPLRAELAHPFM